MWVKHNKILSGKILLLLVILLVGGLTVQDVLEGYSPSVGQEGW